MIDRDLVVCLVESLCTCPGVVFVVFFSSHLTYRLSDRADTAGTCGQ